MKVQFLLSAEEPSQFPKETMPEVAVIGRSNVGKSSLINHLLGQKIAKTSNRPGKTKLINFFEVDRFILVDLPGFGYAEASKKERKHWGHLIERYLEDRKSLKVVLILVEHCRKPLEELELYTWLESRGIHTIIVATKCDRANQSERVKGLRDLAEKFQIVESGILPFSIKDVGGRKRLMGEILKFL